MARHVLYYPMLELQYNAFMHGNKWDMDLPVHVRMAEGDSGMAFSIEDCGGGFEVSSVLSKIKNGEKYYLNYGSGFKRARNIWDGVYFYWERDGRVANCMLIILKRNKKEMFISLLW
jgi:anti-sigma regulatory factor (Ser/Thr protein kinase)